MKKSGNDRNIAKDKRFYTYVAFALTAAMLAIVVIVMAAVLAKDESVSVGGNVSNSSSSSSGLGDESTDDAQDSVRFEDFLLPVEYVSVSNDFGFFHNQTLNVYCEHTGMDFVADAGEEVVAVQSGVIESIYTSDVLSGTQITVDHGNGVKTVYRFVTEKEGLKAGDKVERGDVIATIADATGDEYKDGTHLHFEVLSNGKAIDPTTYLTLAEK